MFDGTFFCIFLSILSPEKFSTCRLNTQTIFTFVYVTSNQLYDIPLDTELTKITEIIPPGLVSSKDFWAYLISAKLESNITWMSLDNGTLIILFTWQELHGRIITLTVLEEKYVHTYTVPVKTLYTLTCRFRFNLTILRIVRQYWRH